MRLTTLLMIATLCLLPLTALQSEQNDTILEDHSDSSRAGRNCDPSFDSTLNSLTYTPDEPVALEIDLSCFEYQLIYDSDPDGKMDFDLQIRLYEENIGNSEQIWFAHQNSKNCVGFNCILWDFNQGSTSFTEVFYLNGPINNGAENDNELWPLAANNLTPYTNYTVQVSLISLNQTYDYTEHHSFSIVPSSNPQPCTPFLKTYATDNSMPNESEISVNYGFRYFSDVVHNHLYLGCLDPLESYQVTWAITLYQSGEEVELGWWNVSGVEYANKTISRSVEAIHDSDGWMVYAISGSVASNSSASISYYPNANSGYSYDGFTVNLSDVDDDGVEDIVDNCKNTQNPDQSDLDSDSIGDVCDEDIDGDDITNSVPYDGTGEDECPFEVASSSQDSDQDGCIDNLDQDGDGILDANDNCILVPNPNQANLDGDAQGDACDVDIDGDNVMNVAPIHVANGIGQDLCPYVDASGKDENQDGCIDEIEPVVCEICEDPVEGNATNTSLDLGDMGAVVVVGGSGMLLGLALAYAAMKALNLARFERTSSDTLAHMPNRKTADLYSDHYSRKGIIRQQEMTLSARMDLDDYVTEDIEGDWTNE